MVNIYAIFKYCSQAGQAYKSQMHEIHFKHGLWVALYWTNISIIIKMLVIQLVPALNPGQTTNGALVDPISPEDGDDSGSDPTTIVYDLLSFALIIACDIVPCMILIDSQFIKILTFDAFRQYEIDIVLKNEQENAKIIEG